MSSNLPKLPVPELGQTLKKFLNTVHPLLTPEEYSHTSEVTEEFLKEEGPYLQRLLLERAASRDNWLSEWWLEVAYLQFRGPIPVYSSPVCLRKKEQFKSVSDMLDQVSKYLHGSGLFFEQIRRGTLSQDRVGNTPLCMHQYESLPGTYRIPGVAMDSLRHSPDSNHILVIHKGLFFKLPILIGEGESKKVLESHLIKHLLSQILATPEEGHVPVGVLTSLDRHTWSIAREEMMKSAVNQHSLDVIEQSLLAVEFDQEGIPDYESLFLQSMTGDLRQNFRYYNRWHDVRYQKLITKDGYSFSCLEHTATDGPPAIRQAAHAYDYTIPVPDLPISPDLLPELEELKWEISPLVNSYITDAKYKLLELSKKLSVKVFSFSDFGKRLPKSRRLSPDSMIQLAIQLTFYKIHDRPTACYESVTTRKFLDGRTDTIRPTSIESTALVIAMCSNQDTTVILRLLREFNTAHGRYSVEAMNGQGIGRHLFGLQLIAKQHDMSPKFFSDLGYTRNTHFRLSTSQLPARDYQYLGYAPLVEDGYGVCYNPQESDIHFIVSSFNSCPDTVTADKFSEILRHSLISVRTLLENIPFPSNL